jgi:hypothetical protein
MSAVECKQQQLFYYQTGYGNMCVSLVDPLLLLSLLLCAHDAGSISADQTV